MKHSTLHSLSLLLFICLACNSAKDKNEANAEHTIKIDIGNLSEFAMEDIASFHSMIPLESTDEIIIGRINKVELTDSLIFIFDMMQNNIFVFDLDGKYKYKIGEKGPGPQEYIRIMDFQLDESRNEIKLSDTGSKRIVTYNLQGDFLYAKRIEYYMYSFFPYKSGHWGVNGGQNTDGYDLIFENNENEIEHGFFPINAQLPLMMTNNFFYNHGDLMYHFSFSNYIYKIEDQKLHPYIYVDFGSKGIDYDLMTDMTNNKIFNSSYLGKIFNVFFHKEKIFFTFVESFENSNEIKIYTCYVSLDTPSKPVIFYNREIKHAPEVIMDLYSEISNVSKSKIIFQMIPEHHPEDYFDLFKNTEYEGIITPDANPVLILYAIND